MTGSYSPVMLANPEQRKSEGKQQKCEETSLAAHTGSLATGQGGIEWVPGQSHSSPLKCFLWEDFRLNAWNTQAEFHTNQFTSHVKFRDKPPEEK